MASTVDHENEDSLPIIPFDIVPEILCKLPLIYLLQFQCVCKPWNSLISDPKFIKKHSLINNTPHLHFISYNSRSYKYVLKSFPIHSVLTNDYNNFTQFEYSNKIFNGDSPRRNSHNFIGSCNGIICISLGYKGLVLLCNPSIRKSKELPPFQMPDNELGEVKKTFGFGYDSFNDNYKVVVVLDYVRIRNFFDRNPLVETTDVKVHTLGTNSWRDIRGFPLEGVPIGQSGKCVSGTINWLASNELLGEFSRFIVSFDLAKESFQKILPPKCDGADLCNLHSLGVLRDCLYVTCGVDVWIMKEYGNQESWTKFFTFPHIEAPSRFYACPNVIHIFEDDQVLLTLLRDVAWNLIIYDSKNGVFKSTSFQNNPEICVESLISPCF